jgi:hypothetical protein
MRRLRRFDRALLVILVPLWGVCFGLYLYRVVHDRLAWMPVFVSAPSSEKDYPIVSGFWLDSGAEQAGLTLGDRLIRVGDVDLRGVGPFGFVVRAYESVDQEQRIVVSFAREDAAGEVKLALRHIGFPWRMLPLSLGFASTAVLTLLRAPSPRLARTFFLAGMTYSLYWTYCFGGGPRTLTYVWAAVFSYASFFMFPLWVRTILLFSEEIAPTGARLPLWPWLFIIYGLAMTSMAFGTPFSHTIGLQANFILNAVFAATMLIVLVRDFRRTGPIGRRQLKWVVYGIYLSTVPVFLADIVTMFNPTWIRLHEIATLSLIFVPICLSIAIVRFNLFDIDRVISATATYTLLSVLFMAGLLAVTPRLSQAVSKVTGFDPTVGQALFSFVLASLVVPGQRYLRPRVERLLFAERHALEQGVEDLLRALSSSAGPQALLTVAGERLNALLRPECCVIYGRAGDAYAPVFAQGRAVPSAFEAHSPLTATLQNRTVPIDLEEWSRRTAQVPSVGFLGQQVLQSHRFHLPRSALLATAQRIPALCAEQTPWA